MHTASFLSWPTWWTTWPTLCHVVHLWVSQSFALTRVAVFEFAPLRKMSQMQFIIHDNVIAAGEVYIIIHLHKSIQFMHVYARGMYKSGVFRTGFCKLLEVSTIINESWAQEIVGQQSHPSQAAQCRCVAVKKLKERTCDLMQNEIIYRKDNEPDPQLPLSNQRTPYHTVLVKRDNSRPFWTGDYRKCCINEVFV